MTPTNEQNDHSIYGVHITKDGKRIDPKDFYMNEEHELTEYLTKNAQKFLGDGQWSPSNLADILIAGGYRRPSPSGKTSRLEEQEFYELMQTYRHAPLHDQDRVVAAYEAVKSYILATIKGGEQ